MQGKYTTLRMSLYALIRRIVLLQAMKEEPAESEKCRDKFLVQSVAVSADQEFSNVTAIVRASSHSLNIH